MSWKIIVTYDVQTVQSWNTVVKRQENWKSPQRFGACVGTHVNGFPMSRRWSVHIWSVIWNTLLMTSALGKWWRCVAKIGIVRRLLLCCYCLFLGSHQRWSVDWSPIMTGQPANQPTWSWIPPMHSSACCVTAVNPHAGGNTPSVYCCPADQGVR